MLSDRQHDHQEGAAGVEDDGHHHAQGGHRDQVGRQGRDDQQPGDQR